jgi:hypothetical protein
MSSLFQGFSQGALAGVSGRLAILVPMSDTYKWSPGKRVAAILGACAVLGGGTFVLVQAASSPATAAATTQAAAAVSTTAQAAVLQSALTAPGARRLERLRLHGGMYGQFTYETREGARTLAYERGTIALVGNGDMVVRAADGTAYTWALTRTSVVRENGTREPVSTLAQGQAVFAGGLITSGTRDARLIVIRKAATTPEDSTPASTTA